ncbi:biliverdin-producing heme oxygenase [Roseateles sp. DAIF2]|uniref:biliverdin-producing heme oxygenase n=1 Tax=Roseateles sp. DAIF2 TaxID=2714952 RepID=UPI0018A25353|nr:biliverdin-producing heme oxygenase [Roseateles sp. DAIF2]QPF75404.1 biliverdin-producing heme oxygenase [Roseateles sp. DAIF2]
MDTTTTSTATLSHSQALKAASHGTHERLDQRIMRAEPFAALANYGRFLQVQWRFHHDIAALYARADLALLLPDLAERQRLREIEQDLADLGLALPAPGAQAPALDPEHCPLAEALGWFYVAEGSNLGAALLFKATAALGLDEQRGARHLAGHPDGRLRHWRGFTGMLDAQPLRPAEQELMAGGARAAFTRVHRHVDELLA